MLHTYQFSDRETPELQEAGGKGLSLILMTRAGFPVPPGFVLPVSFFKSWFKTLMESSEWDGIKDAEGSQLRKKTDSLKKMAKDLAFTQGQIDCILARIDRLNIHDELPLFAVRSSSPEEDLEGASFAGGYETVLGVRKENIQEAVKTAFISCLDERVFIYKRVKGFSCEKPGIAVIIQKQVNPETAGVAFSLNPVNNAYDECVINANFGLGESVVSGMITPDTFIVDKTSRTVMEKKPGKKDKAVFLKSGGGTGIEQNAEPEELCLSHNQVLEITSMTSRVEAYYKKPVDIEWAYSGGKLFLLQARPVTAFIPLPERMITPPGSPKKLYMDFTLIAQGIREPLSVLGMEFFQMMQGAFMASLLGVDVSGLETGFFGNIEGRSFANVSNIMKIPNGGNIMVRLGRNDYLVKEIVNHMDKKAYLAFKLPKQLKGFLFKALKNVLKFYKTANLAYNEPEVYKNRMLEEKDRLFKETKKAVHDKTLSLTDLTGKIIEWYADFINNHSLKITTASHSMALEGMGKLLKKDDPDTRKKLNLLERGLPENVTIEMGLSMYRLSRFPEIKECSDENEFEKRLKNRSLSPEFIKAWEDFIENYGFRCPKELDVATERPYEKPSRLFRQLHTMALNEDPENNADIVFKKAWKDREDAFNSLLTGLKGKKAEQFKKHYHVWVTFGGYREIHKYILIKLIMALRERIIKTGEFFVQAHRLSGTQQVFDLTFNQIEQALKDTSMDILALAEENTYFRRKTAHIKDFPAFIDSRGRVMHPPRKEKREGEYTGEPISAGIVKGKIKVLHEPDEKPVYPGEILVARATDPGWTPLFVNAGGIILEVGGMVQHGAVVAREYGKPCIAGIVDATEIFKDGQVVEMDGMSGIIRLVS